MEAADLLRLDGPAPNGGEHSPVFRGRARGNCEADVLVRDPACRVETAELLIRQVAATTQHALPFGECFLERQMLQAM